jgi:hypothetical protein
MGISEMPFFHLAEGTSKTKVVAEHEVEHDESGLDTEDSPIGGAEGQYCTDLYEVIEITASQKKFLNKIGIY